MWNNTKIADNKLFRNHYFVIKKDNKNIIFNLVVFFEITQNNFGYEKHGQILKKEIICYTKIKCQDHKKLWFDFYL